jgi:hypothetical protein
LTPGKLSTLGEAVGFGKKKSIAATSIVDSIESYKKRSNSLFRNPLDPPKDSLVFHSKPVSQKPPPIMFQSNTNFITGGIGEADNGISKASNIQKLIGHTSNDYKHQFLSQINQQNLAENSAQLHLIEQRRQAELLDDLLNQRREQEEQL